MKNNQPSLIVRRATADDIEHMSDVRARAILELCSAHYATNDLAIWASARFPSNFLEIIGSAVCIVADCEGLVVGMGMLNPETGDVDAVFVSPNCTRQGVATLIMKAIEQAARDANVVTLRLSATLNAVFFYEAMGFVQIEPSVYHSPSGVVLGCMKMEKRLQ